MRILCKRKIVTNLWKPCRCLAFNTVAATAAVAGAACAGNSLSAWRPCRECEPYFSTLDARANLTHKSMAWRVPTTCAYHVPAMLYP